MVITGLESTADNQNPNSEDDTSDIGLRTPESRDGTAPPPVATCPACQAPRPENGDYCNECGLVFDSFVPPPSIQTPQLESSRLKARYQLGELICKRRNVARHRGLDFAARTTEPLPVGILH